LSINKKVAFTVWYFVLWGISSWALIEYFYPPTNYSAYYLMYVAAAAFSLLLLAATGGPLLLYIKRREIRRKRAMLFLVTFLAATVSLTIFLVPQAYVCAATKSKI
jgi:hypothetical protein